MKTILITGSTDGIGKLAATKLAEEGHQLILHGRNEQKLQKTIAEIKEKTNNTSIDGFIADLSDLGSIEQSVSGLQDTYENIDVLINNAGVFKSPIAQNAEGLDLRFAVNYLAPYLLTESLLPLLQQSEAARIINLSSAAQSSVDLDALSGKRAIDTQEAYAQSKLALTMWSMDLAQQADGITVIAVNPGSLLNTNMVNEAYGHHWSSADKGADILYDLATDDRYADSNGAYFDNDKESIGRAHPDAYNRDMIEDLIRTTEQILGR